MRALMAGIAMLVAGAAAPAAVDEATLAAQRQLFGSAHRALTQGDEAAFARLAARLRDYPLHPYLLYWDLRRRIDRAPDREIEDFLARYADLPPAERLRGAWLERLAAKGRWRKYLEVYDGRADTRLRCHALRARMATGEDGDALHEDILDLWLVGRSQPKECDPPFERLYASGEVTPALLWERIGLAMERGNLRLARFLARRLPEADRGWVELWAQAHRRPEETLSDPRLRVDDEHARRIVRHAVLRLARFDAAGAHAAWHRLDGNYSYDPAVLAEVDRRIAVLAAFQHLPEAQPWLEALSEQAVTSRERQWRVRAALRNRDWDAVVEAIGALSAGARGSDRWQYWLARALEQVGHPEGARQIFQHLAGDVGYYGFLAAERLGRDYTLVSEAVVGPQDRDRARDLLAIPAVLRARELFLLDRVTEARREWYMALADMDEAQLKLAALLADEWRWHDNAILTVARTDHRKDLDLRFPLPFRDQILDQARRRDLDPAWIYGVVRRESAFMTDARSVRGALGLMQLMPATARAVSRELGLGRPRTYDILDIDRNLALGSAYLRKVLDRFDGSQVLATAAYNAGPSRVRRWLPDGEGLPADLWVETVPFRETRNYVGAVMAYTTIFDWKLDERVTPLSRRMPPVRGEVEADGP